MRQHVVLSLQQHAVTPKALAPGQPAPGHTLAAPHFVSATPAVLQTVVLWLVRLVCVMRLLRPCMLRSVRVLLRQLLLGQQRQVAGKGHERLLCACAVVRVLRLLRVRALVASKGHECVLGACAVVLRRVRVVCEGRRLLRVLRLLLQQQPLLLSQRSGHPAWVQRVRVCTMRMTTAGTFHMGTARSVSAAHGGRHGVAHGEADGACRHALMRARVRARVGEARLVELTDSWRQVGGRGGEVWRLRLLLLLRELQRVQVGVRERIEDGGAADVCGAQREGGGRA